MQALWDACDLYFMPGSATTKTTIEVSDLTDGNTPYTVELDNVWDSYDITFEPALEVIDTLWMLGSDPDGVLDVRLDSVDFQATISTSASRVGSSTSRCRTVSRPATTSCA